MLLSSANGQSAVVQNLSPHTRLRGDKQQQQVSDRFASGRCGVAQCLQQRWQECRRTRRPAPRRACSHVRVQGSHARVEHLRRNASAWNTEGGVRPSSSLEVKKQRGEALQLTSALLLSCNSTSAAATAQEACACVNATPGEAACTERVSLWTDDRHQKRRERRRQQAGNAAKHAGKASTGCAHLPLSRCVQSLSRRRSVLHGA